MNHVGEAMKVHGGAAYIIDDVKTLLARTPDVAQARHLAETLGWALQGAVLVRSAPDFVSEVFCATWLGDRLGLTYGAIDVWIDVGRLVGRAMPQI